MTLLLEPYKRHFPLSLSFEKTPSKQNHHIILVGRLGKSDVLLGPAITEKFLLKINEYCSYKTP